MERPVLITKSLIVRVRMWAPSREAAAEFADDLNERVQWTAKQEARARRHKVEVTEVGGYVTGDRVHVGEIR